MNYYAHYVGDARMKLLTMLLTPPPLSSGRSSIVLLASLLCHEVCVYVCVLQGVILLIRPEGNDVSTLSTEIFIIIL